jgi:uncharacterized membrane protein (UPF0127 family)
VRRAFVLAVAFLAACDRGGEEEVPPSADANTAPPASVTQVSFDTASAYVEADGQRIPLRVELARTVDQQSFGLMDRDSLSPSAGMVFLYETPQPTDGSFYMFRTRIPLDIAFFDGTGRIVSILHMTPCTSPQPQQCELYSPGMSYLGALEVNAGWLAAHGVEVGDRVVVPGHLGN